MFDCLRKPRGLTYVGRLDVDTTGLLLLTSDGDAVHRLTHPSYRVPRSYTALVHGRPTAEIETAVHRRVVVDGAPVVPTGIRVRPGKAGRSHLDVTLTEGRNRIVRRWCEALGLKVERLARLSYGPVRLGELKVGEARPLTEREAGQLYRVIGLAPPVGTTHRAAAASGADKVRKTGYPAPAQTRPQRRSARHPHGPSRQ